MRVIIIEHRARVESKETVLLSVLRARAWQSHWLSSCRVVINLIKSSESYQKILLIRWKVGREGISEYDRDEIFSDTFTIYDLHVMRHLRDSITLDLFSRCTTEGSFKLIVKEIHEETPVHLRWREIGTSVVARQDVASRIPGGSLSISSCQIHRGHLRGWTVLVILESPRGSKDLYRIRAFVPASNFQLPIIYHISVSL